jgi:hypothetical protein
MRVRDKREKDRLKTSLKKKAKKLQTKAVVQIQAVMRGCLVRMKTVFMLRRHVSGE